MNLVWIWLSPHLTPESFGFNGHLYVVLDSSYFVKRAVFNFPKKINPEFVDLYVARTVNSNVPKTAALTDHESMVG